MSTVSDAGREESPWRFVSFAIVVNDNLKGDEKIDVWLTELLPYEEGQIADIDDEESQVLLDLSGQPRKATINRQAKIPAYWYPTVDGRQTPPNVTNGETVEIYQYANTDRYRWVSNGRQPNIRRLEHVTHAFSDLRGGREAFTRDSSYGYTFSTREKFVDIWTSRGDGEPVAYRFFLDAREEIAGIEDDKGNFFKIISNNNRVRMENRSGHYVEVHEGGITASRGGASMSMGERDIILSLENNTGGMRRSMARSANPSFGSMGTNPQSNNVDNATIANKSRLYDDYTEATDRHDSGGSQNDEMAPRDTIRVRNDNIEIYTANHDVIQLKDGVIETLTRHGDFSRFEHDDIEISTVSGDKLHLKNNDIVLRTNSGDRLRYKDNDIYLANKAGYFIELKPERMNFKSPEFHFDGKMFTNDIVARDVQAWSLSGGLNHGTGYGGEVRLDRKTNVNARMAFTEPPMEVFQAPPEESVEELKARIARLEEQVQQLLARG